MHVGSRVWMPEVNTGCLSQPYSLRQILSLDLRLASWLGSLTGKSKDPPVCPELCHSCGFDGSKPKFSCLCSKPLIPPLSSFFHLYSPSPEGSGREDHCGPCLATLLGLLPYACPTLAL